MQRRVDDVLSQTLRAAHHTLGFGRAIFFFDEGQRARAGLVFDEGNELKPSDVAISPASGGSFATARSGIPVWGAATDLWAPLVDVRRRYFLSALNHAGAPYGFLYADGPRSDVSGAADLETIANLSAIAAVASQNALIFERAQELASRDPLTGLLNRRALHERLQQELESGRRRATSFVYLLLDLDDFKRVNDRTGHAAGDALLHRLANALTAMSRAQDVVARIGGDEFVIVMLDAEPRLAVSSVARISELLKLQGFHCSVGAALYPRDGLDASTLTWAADRALYIAKAAGKDRFAFA